MFYEELKHIIRSILEQGLGGQSLMEALTANINPTELYASDDMLVTDSYFSLSHYAIGEEIVTEVQFIIVSGVSQMDMIYLVRKSIFSISLIE